MRTGQLSLPHCVTSVTINKSYLCKYYVNGKDVEEGIFIFFKCYNFGKAISF